jgi:hypothetical protein
LEIYCKRISDVMNLLHCTDVLWLNMVSKSDQICIISKLFKFKVHTWNFDKKTWKSQFSSSSLCILICGYQFCCAVPRFWKAIKQHVFKTPTNQKQSLRSGTLPRPALQRNVSYWTWNIFIGRNMNFVFPDSSNLAF